MKSIFMPRVRFFNYTLPKSLNKYFSSHTQTHNPLIDANTIVLNIKFPKVGSEHESVAN